MFKRVCSVARVGDSWTPRELRTSFVSLMSHRGVSIEEIAHLAGHASTSLGLSPGSGPSLIL
jgi:site-specific recombinase XerD